VRSKREQFFRLADAVVDDGESDAWTAEPWPSWFQKVVLRLTRVFLPTLKAAEFKKNRERFEGYGLAFVKRLVEETGKVDTKTLPTGPVFDWVKAELQTISSLVPEKLENALHAASALPSELGGEFFAAYSDGLKKDTFKLALQRLGDSQTAQICLFLVFARPWIEADKIVSVTVLFETFMKIKEQFPGQREFFERHDEAHRSLEAQFRNICSEDGLKVRGRGRPRKIQSGHV
jgi:hypothetical protein